jgi:O-antigen/teichoic acid export membrane protein
LWGAEGVALLTTLVQTMFVARVLGPRSYGVAALIISIPAFVFTFLDPQSESAVVRYLTRFERAKEPQRAAAAVKTAYLVDLGLAAAGSAVVLLLAGWAARHLVEDPTTTWLVALAALGLSTAGPAATSRAVLSTFGHFSRIASLSVAASIIRNGSMIALVALGLGIRGVVFGAVAGQVFESVILYVASRRVLRERTSLTLRTVSAGALQPYRGEVLRFMAYTEMTTLATAFIKHGDVLLLGLARGPTEVGFYRLASSLAGIAGRIVTPLQAVVYPDVARIAAAGDEAGLRRLVRRHFLTIGLPLALLGAIALPFVGPSMRIAAGTAYGPAASVCQVILVGTLMGLMTYWLRPLYLATGRERLFFALTVPVAIVTIGAMALAAHSAGAIGVAWARVLGASVLGTGVALTALARERRALIRSGGGGEPDDPPAPGATWLAVEGPSEPQP